MSLSPTHYIVGVHITDRVKNVPSVQAVLTEFGGFIKTRLGLHDITNDSNATNGLLIVELLGEDGKYEAFVQALKAVEGVDVQHMVFKHY